MVYENLGLHINSFYEKYHELKINDISKDKIDELKKASIDLSYYFNECFDYILKIQKYVRVLEKIITSSKKLGANNSTEKLLLFMFIVDPNLEVIKIYEEENNLKNIKPRIQKQFGVYDHNLIKIERWYIKNVLDKESKKQIEDEIERRVFK